MAADVPAAALQVMSTRMKMKMRDRDSERGNVLWFLMIGVALLAAITMVVSRGGSSTDQTGDYEQRSIQASQILRYARGIEATVQRMKLNGVSENDISFENSVSTTDYTNANCGTDDCMVFEAAGGGQNYMAPKAAWLDSANSAEDYYGDWLFTGSSCIPDVGNGGNLCIFSSSTLELMIILPYIKLDLCKQLNILAKASVTTGNPPQDADSAWAASSEFTGTYGGGLNRLIADTGYADIVDVTTGCFEGGGASAGSALGEG